MKKSMKVIMMAALTAAAVAAIFLAKNQLKEVEDKEEKEAQILEIPNVVCWGDSLTEGVGGNGTSYPAILKERIRIYLSQAVMDAGIIEETANILVDDIYCMEVANQGISGESSLSIAARAGGVTMVTTAELKVGLMGVKAELHFATEDGRVVEPWHSENLVPAAVSIHRTEGVMGFNNKEYQYYFKADEWITSQTIPAGTAIIPQGLERYEDDITIIFIGQNGGYTDYEDLIAQQKSMIPEAVYEEGRYLILGLTSGTKAERSELEAVMEAEYGKNYVNLREILSGDRIFDYVTELSREDLTSMEKGQVPQALRAPEDLVHLNEHGYEMVGDAVLERMQELGFFDEVIEKINSFVAQEY